jgi:hypothetical protein
MDRSGRSTNLTLGMLPPSSVGRAGEDSSQQEGQSDVQDDVQDFIRSTMGVLSGIETSLKNSQRALLARDISSVERETHEQQRLQQALTELWARCLASVQKADAPFELRAAQGRVRHLARVQLALLGRAGRSLYVFSHLLKGPGAGYGLPASMNPNLWAWPSANDTKNDTRKGASCRA